ncbi:MAG: hypothetical protein QXH30_01920 [Candidatus Bilamarchaeaceae archaeon]
MNMGMSMRLTSFRCSTIHLVRARRGKLPKTVMLAAPHTNEHGAVLVPQTALKKRLEESGVEVKVRNRLGMIAKLWKMRKMLDREFPDSSSRSDVSNLITPLLSVKDFQLRLAEMSDFFSKSPDGVFMELHAMNHEVMLNSHLLSQLEAEEFLQISGTNMLICRNAISSFADAVSRAEQDEADVHSSIKLFITERWQERVAALLLSIKSRIEEFFEFSFKESLEQCRAALCELAGKKDRVFIVEIPSIARDLPQAHPMHSFYFKLRNAVPEYVLCPPSSFEEAYAALMRDLISFTPKDAEALLNQLKVC